jgi:outer membrane lipoprotein carrier protein
MTRGLAFLTFLVLPVSLLGKGEAAELTARLEARYRSAKTLQATFLERYSENGRLLRSESGTAYFRRPGKMRWEYEAPESDLFLVDGKTAWFYVPADHAVTRVPARQSADYRTPMALLAGEMKVSRICSYVDLAVGEKAQTPGDVVLHCAVRGAENQAARRGSASGAAHDMQTDEVLFEVVPQSGDLARILVRQAGGVEIEFRFANWRLDPPLPEPMFRFQVPSGVAIVNGNSQSNENLRE